MPVTLDERLAAKTTRLDQRQAKLAQDLAVHREKMRKAYVRESIAVRRMIEDTGLLRLSKDELLRELLSLARRIERTKGIVLRAQPSEVTNLSQVADAAE